jgi:hypothetical protein
MSRVVHLSREGDPGRPQCGARARARLTTDADKVTCWSCRNSRAYEVAQSAGWIHVSHALCGQTHRRRLKRSEQ